MRDKFQRPVILLVTLVASTSTLGACSTIAGEGAESIIRQGDRN